MKRIIIAFIVMTTMLVACGTKEGRIDVSEHKTVAENRTEFTITDRPDDETGRISAKVADRTAQIGDLDSKGIRAEQLSERNRTRGECQINPADDGNTVEIDQGTDFMENTGGMEETKGPDEVSEGSDFGGNDEHIEPMSEFTVSDSEECDDGGYSEPSEDAWSGEEGLTYLGVWTTTAYCPCEICCGVWATGCTASGVMATPSHTVACGSLPFGTQVMIDGVIYTVEDTGVEGEWIDIFFDSHDEASAYGLQYKEVYLVGV